MTVQRVYCLLKDRPGTFRNVGDALGGEHRYAFASRAIHHLRDSGDLECRGYSPNPDWMPDGEEPRWIQVWGVRT